MAIPEIVHRVGADKSTNSRREARRLTRRGFLLRTAAVDVLALVIAVAAASTILFRTPAPWLADQVGYRVLPFLGYLVASAILTAALTAGMSQRVPLRPSYVRGALIVGGTFVTTSVLALLTFSYVSRSLFALTIGIWTILVFAHRIWQRRKPWCERMVIVSAEESLVAALRKGEHAEVLSVVPPQAQERLPLPGRGVTVAR